MKPGPRDLYANLIMVSTPDNFYGCNLAYTSGIGQFHGLRLRSRTGGQCPVVVYKALKKGKGQGKSAVARAVCYLVSDWKTNKLSHKLSTEAIRKKQSFTTCPLYFDDVKKDTFINRITEGFDDGETYETAEGTYRKRAEIFFSANYFSMDENASSDSERICDRLCVIPFVEWQYMPAAEFSRRQTRFMNVVDSEVKPTEFVIKEMGDFIGSQEFMEKREYFGQWLYERAEVVKMRTLLTNYASFYALNWKTSQIFESEWTKMGKSWQGFLDWAEQVHVPFLIGQHMEKDHSIHSIRRYGNGLLDFVNGFSDSDILKFMKICQTSKTKSKHVLALHPDKKYPSFRELGQVSLIDVKQHLPSVGGIWDDTTFATLLRADVDDKDSSNITENMVAKRALLIPMNVFTSSQIMKICDVTGQKEYYSLADSETPSGVEDVVNSTSMTSGLRLAVSDVSSIHAIPNTMLDEVEVDEFASPEPDLVQVRSLKIFVNWCIRF